MSEFTLEQVDTTQFPQFYKWTYRGGRYTYNGGDSVYTAAVRGGLIVESNIAIAFRVALY